MPAALAHVERAPLRRGATAVPRLPLLGRTQDPDRILPRHPERRQQARGQCSEGEEQDRSSHHHRFEWLGFVQKLLQYSIEQHRGTKPQCRSDRKQSQTLANEP